MRILIDIGHPAHVHYFRNAIKILEEKGHKIRVTARDKEVSLQLLDHYQIPYICTGKNYKSILGKAYSVIRNEFHILKAALDFKPDIFVSFFLPFPSHVGFLLNRPVVGFTDTENAKLNIWISKYFTDHIITPSCYIGDFGKKHFRFDGYMELCYLHPNYFKPDGSIFDLLKINKGENYVILRFVSWKASHDFGHDGINDEMKKKIIYELSKYAKVFVSSETELPKDIKKYKVEIPPERMHDALAYASLLYGESATMASESACLGTPAIFLDNDGRGYTDDQGKYGLVYNYSESIGDQEKSLLKAIELLKEPKKEFEMRHQIMLEDKIDVTSFMIWFLDSYPESKQILEQNPEYGRMFL